MYTLHITGTESEVKDYERKFEGGQWLPFGETATLEDSTNKADPVSHHNRYTPVCMKQMYMCTLCYSPHLRPKNKSWKKT